MPIHSRAIAFLSRLPSLVVLPIVAMTATHAIAHGGEHHEPTTGGQIAGPWWAQWTFDLPIIAVLGGVTLIYATGLGRLWRSAGVGRGVRISQATAFGAGIAALVISLLSPIDAFADELGWVHMVQHMILMMIAAPLMILGGGAIASLWALPAPLRRRGAAWLARARAWRVPQYLLWQPLLTFALFGLTLWVWHVPSLYEAALRFEPVHDLQHLMFFITACLFWRVLVDPLSRLRMSPGLGVLYLFGTSLHATFLGVFMALAPSAWYAWYESTAPAWNLSALEDQQLAGLIMWMPMCMAYALAAAVIFGLWLRDDGDLSAPATAQQADARSSALR